MSTARGTLLNKTRLQPHRYSIYRTATQTTTLAIVYAIPLLHWARFDSWGGEHYALGRRVGAFEGLVAIFVGMAALYLVTFLANFFCGRLFCGWGCPVAQLSRLGEAVEWEKAGTRKRFVASLRGLVFGGLLSAGVLLWWVDPRVLLEGTLLAQATTFTILAAVVASTYLHGRFLRWTFCRKACPIGLYYSVVAMEESHGVIFERAQSTCKECRACHLVCPVGLNPRELSESREGIGGLAIEGLPADHHCLRCGDCVATCEYVFRRGRQDDVPLRFGFGRNGRPLEPRLPRNGCSSDAQGIGARSAERTGSTEGRSAHSAPTASG